MSKPTDLQLRVIAAIKAELDYWATSNDIHSPSHFTSVNEMFNNLDEYEFGEGPWCDELELLTDIVADLLQNVADMSPCAIREQQRKEFNP